MAILLACFTTNTEYRYQYQELLDYSMMISSRPNAWENFTILPQCSCGISAGIGSKVTDTDTNRYQQYY